MAVECWTMGGGLPTSDDPAVFDGVQMAVQAEQMGYDGIVWVDSQNLAADCYISMALAAHATSRIQLGTGVTNSFTRHAAITASCIATVQAESRGRAHMGIGRGDYSGAVIVEARASGRALQATIPPTRLFLQQQVSGNWSGNALPRASDEAVYRADGVLVFDRRVASLIEVGRVCVVHPVDEHFPHMPSVVSVRAFQADNLVASL